MKGHKYRFVAELVKNCILRKNFFNNRVVEYWIKLAEQIIQATRI